MPTYGELEPSGHSSLSQIIPIDTALKHFLHSLRTINQMTLTHTHPLPIPGADFPTQALQLELQNVPRPP